MCSPSQSLYPKIESTNDSKTFDNTYMTATTTTHGKAKKMLLTITKEEAYRVASRISEYPEEC